VNLNLLSKEVQVFISNHAQARGSDLLLKGINLPNVSASEVVQQLESRQKLAPKAPVFTNTPNIYMPPKLSAEQASSQLLAEFKATLVNGSTCIDLTGGMGVDTYYLSQQFPQMHYCEIDEELAAITKHNFEQLGAQHIQTHQGNGIEILKNFKEEVDLAFLDPARRGNQGKKVFLLEQCTPNILEHWEMLLNKARVVMIKLSPMIDIHYLIKTLSHITDVCVVAEKNEVKEVLVVASKNAEITSVNIHATVLRKESDPTSFTYAFDSESALISISALPQGVPIYLYEPAAALLKAGGQDRYTQSHNLTKLDTHSHLYWSLNRIPEFIGRKYKVREVLKVDKKALKKALPEQKANIICRNFPLKPAEIAKKLGVKEGGDLFLLCTTIKGEGKRVILTELAN